MLYQNTTPTPTVTAFAWWKVTARSLMPQDLIALGLRRPPGQAAGALPTAIPIVSHNPASAILLDAMLALVRDLLAADEDGKRSELAQKFEACRVALAGGATAGRLTELSTACLAE